MLRLYCLAAGGDLCDDDTDFFPLVAGFASFSHIQLLDWQRMGGRAGKPATELITAASVKNARGTIRGAGAGSNHTSVTSPPAGGK